MLKKNLRIQIVIKNNNEEVKVKFFLQTLFFTSEYLTWKVETCSRLCLYQFINRSMCVKFQLISYNPSIASQITISNTYMIHANLNLSFNLHPFILGVEREKIYLFRMYPSFVFQALIICQILASQIHLIYNR